MRAVAWLVVLSACSYAPNAATTDGEPMPVDSPPTDAPVDGELEKDSSSSFTCPPSYDVTIPATTSRYRVIVSNATFWSHRTTCNESEATHLAVVDSMLEGTQLKAEAQAKPSQPSQGRFYLGAIQDASSATLGGSWIWVTGGAVPAGAWGIFNGVQQPDDGPDANENNHEEQLAAFDPNVALLIDVKGMTGYGAVCECDGVGETQTAIELIDKDPNNPN